MDLIASEYGWGFTEIFSLTELQLSVLCDAIIQRRFKDRQFLAQLSDKKLQGQAPRSIIKPYLGGEIKITQEEEEMMMRAIKAHNRARLEKDIALRHKALANGK